MKGILFIAVSLIGISSFYPQTGTIAGKMKNAIINSAGDLQIQASARSSSDDFNFLVGPHTVRHKKLKSRLSNSKEWIEFDGTHFQELILNGIGNIEQHHMTSDSSQPVDGMALRLFNTRTRLWTIYWADSETGCLGTPVTGSFENGIGHFYAKDYFDCRAILVQFKWDLTNVNKPIWSQAFSIDNGNTWEWNWHMYFTKTDLAKVAFDQLFPESTETDRVGVLEVRNYLVKRGKRDQFIDFFEETIEPQTQQKGYPVGQYTVKGEEDNFCWIRGFSNMESRSAFLPAFYYSDYWKRNRKTANDLIANSDNVHLLRPLALDGDTLIAIGGVKKESLNPHGGIMVIEFYTANSKVGQLKQFFAKKYLPLLRSAGVSELTIWESELAENDFPKLPVFQDKNLLVTIAFYDDEEDYKAKMALVKSKMNENLTAEYLDLVTIKSSLILYPTDLTKKMSGSRFVRQAETFQHPLKVKPVSILSAGELEIKASMTSNAHDYNFIMGPHTVVHKKLVDRLNNSSSWLEFKGTKSTRKILSGIGNVEQHFLNNNEGVPMEAIALRLFNPTTRLWSLYWADSKNGTLDPPLVGSFEGDLGVFFGRDFAAGKEILVQFQYDRSNPENPIWGQAFSGDNGQTWEWNWFMFYKGLASAK
jgi:hypothetical protein